MRTLLMLGLSFLFFALGGGGIAKDVARIRKKLREHAVVGVVAVLESLFFGGWGSLGIISLVLAAFFLMAGVQ